MMGIRKRNLERIESASISDSCEHAYNLSNLSNTCSLLCGLVVWATRLTAQVGLQTESVAYLEYIDGGTSETRVQKLIPSSGTTLQLGADAAAWECGPMLGSAHCHQQS
jgi:hypothetical protein